MRMNMTVLLFASLECRIESASVISAIGTATLVAGFLPTSIPGNMDFCGRPVSLLCKTRVLSQVAASSASRSVRVGRTGWWAVKTL